MSNKCDWHITETLKEPLRSSEWGFSAIFSNFSSTSSGVCNNFQFEIMRQFSDPNGRFTIVDMKMANGIMTLVNIYALNDDNPAL